MHLATLDYIVKISWMINEELTRSVVYYKDFPVFEFHLYQILKFRSRGIFT